LLEGPVDAVADGGITTGTTSTGLEITVVFTEPEPLVVVDVDVTGRDTTGALATDVGVEFERPSKRIV
jgi:hypothetical protein